MTISFVSSQQRAQTTICSNSMFVIVLFSVALKFSRLHLDPSHEWEVFRYIHVKPFLLATLPLLSILEQQFLGSATCYRGKLLLVQLFYLVDEARITLAAFLLFRTLLFLIWCDDLHGYHWDRAHLVRFSVGTVEKEQTSSLAVFPDTCCCSDTANPHIAQF